MPTSTLLLEEPKSYHHFKPQSTFSNAISLYRFDKKLRLFLFNEIEKIEVAFRSAIANIVAEETGNIFWMTDASMFANEAKFLRTMSLIEKELNSSKEEFIKHFRKKYSNDYPPAWMLVEILPLGVVTRIFENIESNALLQQQSALAPFGILLKHTDLNYFLYNVQWDKIKFLRLASISTDAQE